MAPLGVSQCLEPDTPPPESLFDPLCFQMPWPSFFAWKILLTLPCTPKTPHPTPVPLTPICPWVTGNSHGTPSTRQAAHVPLEHVYPPPGLQAGTLLIAGSQRPIRMPYILGSAQNLAQ